MDASIRSTTAAISTDAVLRPAPVIEADRDRRVVARQNLKTALLASSVTADMSPGELQQLTLEADVFIDRLASRIAGPLLSFARLDKEERPWIQGMSGQGWAALQKYAQAINGVPITTAQMSSTLDLDAAFIKALGSLNAHTLRISTPLSRWQHEQLFHAMPALELVHSIGTTTGPKLRPAVLTHLRAEFPPAGAKESRKRVRIAWRALDAEVNRQSPTLEATHAAAMHVLKLAPEMPSSRLATRFQSCLQHTTETGNEPCTRGIVRALLNNEEELLDDQRVLSWVVGSAVPDRVAHPHVSKAGAESRSKAQATRVAQEGWQGNVRARDRAVQLADDLDASDAPDGEKIKARARAILLQDVVNGDSLAARRQAAPARRAGFYPDRHDTEQAEVSGRRHTNKVFVPALGAFAEDQPGPVNDDLAMTQAQTWEPFQAPVSTPQAIRPPLMHTLFRKPTGPGDDMYPLVIRYIAAAALMDELMQSGLDDADVVAAVASIHSTTGGDMTWAQIAMQNGHPGAVGMAIARILEAPIDHEQKAALLVALDVEPDDVVAALRDPRWHKAGSWAGTLIHQIEAGILQVASEF